MGHGSLVHAKQETHLPEFPSAASVLKGRSCRACLDKWSVRAVLPRLLVNSRHECAKHFERQTQPLVLSFETWPGPAAVI